MPSNLITIAVVVIGIIIILGGVFSMWKKVPKDKAMVISGMRKKPVVVTGKGALVVPVLDRVDFISLANIQLNVMTQNSMSSQGVPINVSATAVIKVKNDTESILSAIEQFNGKNEAEIGRTIESIATNVLEGKLREIVASMTVEEIYKDREAFTSKVQEVVSSEIATMGLKVGTFTINEISDPNGYIEALGVAQIADVKKASEIAKADARREQDTKVAEATKLGEKAKLQSQTEIAEANKQKSVQEAEYRREEQASKAKADASYDIQKAITSKEVIDATADATLLEQERQKEIQEARIQVDIIAEQKNIELAEKQALRKKAALQAEVVEPALANKQKLQADAEAEKFRQIAEAEARAEASKRQAEADAHITEISAKAEAEAVRKKAQAEAEATREVAEAEAAGIRAKGIAEAEAMEKKAEAYKKYSSAAMTEMLIKVLPGIAESYAKQFAQIGKITIVGGDAKSGVNSVMNSVPAAMAGLIESMKETTGIDMTDLMMADSKSAKTDKNVNVSLDEDALLSLKKFKEMEKEEKTESGLKENQTMKENVFEDDTY
ncbi:MAG: SPFH domain-containing protein [Eubacteriales bacterium]|nr:SPFH domain-containing protein [Eubacteriales bacterium]